MRVFKYISYISFITLTALLYVHQQTELVKLSYTIDSKEKCLKQMVDRNDTLGYNVNNLQSPSRLEKALASKNVEMAFPKQAQVVKMPGPRMNNAARVKAAGVEKKTNTFGILEFFGLRTEAHAKEK